MRVSFYDDDMEVLKLVNVLEAVMFSEFGIGIAFREAGTMYNDSRGYQNGYNDIAIFAVPECDGNGDCRIFKDFTQLLEKGYLHIDISFYRKYHIANTDMSIEKYAEKIRPIVESIHS